MKRWLLTVLLQLDALVNALFGGYAGESISYRLALNAQDGGAFGCWFCQTIEQWLPGHCDMTAPSKGMRLSRQSKLSSDLAAGLTLMNKD